VVIGRTLTIICLFFEKAEVGAGLRLGALFVGDSFDCVAEGGHGWLLVMCVCIYGVDDDLCISKVDSSIIGPTTITTATITQQLAAKQSSLCVFAVT